MRTRAFLANRRRYLQCRYYIPGGLHRKNVLYCKYKYRFWSQSIIDRLRLCKANKRFRPNPQSGLKSAESAPYAHRFPFDRVRCCKFRPKDHRRRQAMRGYSTSVFADRQQQPLTSPYGSCNGKVPHRPYRSISSRRNLRKFY